MTIRHAALAVPAIALLVALATTAGRVAVPPQPAVLAAAAVAVVAATTWGGARPRLLPDLTLAAVAGLAASHLLLGQELPHGHDTLAHLWGTWSVSRQALAGDLYPRWLHHVGMGLPLLQFQPPLPYLATVPLAALGVPWPRTLGVAFAGFGVAAAVAMYLVVARLSGDRRAALVAATAYAFAPYRLLDAGYRMALGETAAMAVLPLALFTTAEAARRGGRSALAAGVAVAALVACHPLTALTGAVAVAAWTLTEASYGPVAGAPRRIIRAVARVAGCWVLGAALAGFYTVPFVFEAPFVDRASFEAPGFSRHALEPLQLVWRRPWGALLESRPAGAAGDHPAAEMPFYVGLVMLGFLLVAVTFRPGAGHRGRSGSMVTPPGLLVATFTCLLLTVRPFAAWAEAAMPPLAALQFSWRFLAVASAGAAAAVGCVVAAASRQPGRRGWSRLLPGLAAAALIVDAAPFTGAAERLPAAPTFGFVRQVADCGREARCWEHRPLPAPWPTRVAGMFLPPPDLATDVSLFWWAYPELHTPVVSSHFVDRPTQRRLAAAGVGAFAAPGEPLRLLEPAPYARWRPSGGGPAETRPWRRAGGEIQVEVDGRPGAVLVLEQYFPGWQVLGPDGWREAKPSPRGLLAAPVVGGQRQVRFRFTERRWDRLVGWGVSAVALLVVALGWRSGDRRPRAVPPQRAATRFGGGTD